MKFILPALILFLSILHSSLANSERAQNQPANERREALLVDVVSAQIQNQDSAQNDINQKIGIVEGQADGSCFRTKNGNLQLNTPISIVTSLNEKPQKVLSAEVGEKLEAKCSRYASESTDKNPGENYYYSLILTDDPTDEYQEIFGIGIIAPQKPVRIVDDLASIDLNNDGRDEFFRRCAGNEGILLAIWTGKPLKGKQIWYSFYYLDYDTVPNCKKKDSARIENENGERNDER